MTDREKLIKILESTESAIYWNSEDKSFIRKIADHLIANGVTFVPDNNVGNMWIPVTERLPDEDTLVLCVGAKGGMFLGYVRWLTRDKTVAYTSVPNSRGGRYTKYWMPLPEPPETK